MGLHYSQEIKEDLRLLQVGVSVERVLKRAREKSYAKGYQSPNNTFDRSLLSPKDYGKEYGSKDKRVDMSSTDTLGSKINDVIVEAIFPMKLLLRITSKKIDAKFLSFYFKVLTMDKLINMNMAKFFNFTEQTIQELPYLMKKEEYLRALREISDTKDPQVIFPCIYGGW